MVKNPPDNAEDTRDTSSIPELEGSPGEGNGNPLQYSCLENSMDRGAWWGYSPQGHKESDVTEWAHTHTYTHMLLCRSHQYDTQWQQESEELQNHTEIYPLGVTTNPKQSASPFHDSCGCGSVITMRIIHAETLRESESCSVSLVLEPLEHS